MTESAERALLPAGLRDLLPPEAAHEAHVANRLLSCFRSHGYEQVKPPLLEFEEALLSGPGTALAAQTFRLMDPVSQRMMGLRADMTPQVARLAASRLAGSPRPLRLCYAGQVLQVRGSQLRPERQFGQVGVELLGAGQAAADAEVILLGAESLRNVGVENLTVDLNLPPLVVSIAADLGFGDGECRAIAMALDRKDAAAVEELTRERSPIFLALLQAAGPSAEALTKLAALDLPEAARKAARRIEEVAALISEAMPDLDTTIDPVEHRGFEYQTGISFIFFARGVRGELGRGGRYKALGDPQDAPSNGESSTGFSLFMDTVMRAVPAAEPEKRIFVPFGTPRDVLRELQSNGWITVGGLSPDEPLEATARRLGCAYLLAGKDVVGLGLAAKAKGE
jgi:ATP phosphoribosyltransferase regulatory subunit